jgi:CRP-like cAMP-binding protein
VTSLAPVPGTVETTYFAHSRSLARVQTPRVSNFPNVVVETALGCVSRASLFRGLSRDQQDQIASAAQQLDFSRRETIFREDDPVRWVYVVASGRVKTTQLSHGGKEVILRVEGAGEVLDGLALSPGRAHSLSAQTIEACRVFKWEVDTFHAFADQFANLRVNIVSILSDRLQTLQERFRDLATERVPQRLARLLVRLFDQSPVAATSGSIDLSCEELAQMAGTTLFTVSRLLCDWAEQGIIQPERKALIVASLPALLEVANGVAGLV